MPKSNVPGEKAAPTQPNSPRHSRRSPASGLASRRSPISSASAIAAARRSELRYDGRFTPPSLKGSLIYPATVGGVEWGGGAIDPTTNTYVVNSSSVVQIYQLIKRETTPRRATTGRSPATPPRKARHTGFISPTSPTRSACRAGSRPTARLSSYDLNTGKLLWKEPFGEVQKWGFYMPKSWGSVTIGAPVVTKSGLIFIGGFDGFPRARHRPQVRQGPVEASGRCTRPCRCPPSTPTRARNTCSSRSAATPS